MRQGDLTQRLLTDICNGQNFDWRFSTEPADVVFNKKVVRAWIKAWNDDPKPFIWTQSTDVILAKLKANAPSV